MRPEQAAAGSLYGSPLDETEQRDALLGGAVPVAIYGLGKMGLPLAAVYADRTGNVTGVDLDRSVVDRVNRGECPFDHEPELPELVAETVERGALGATTDGAAAARAATLHVVIVPTLVRDGHPDLGAVEAVVDTVASGLSPGDLVVVESTVPPGTCRDVVAPRLASGSGLERGTFGVAFCPERTSSTRALTDIRGAYPKIVGGVDAESTRAAALVYDALTTNEVVTVADATTAECVKVFEGAYRDVNIALANELARLAPALGADVLEAIEAANTQPYCHLHAPGIGVGGHCIPYYPQFLIGEYGVETPLLETARTVNDGMPAFAVDRLVERLASVGVEPAAATVLVLGVTYRPGIPETRHTPAVPVVATLRDRGCAVLVADPVVEATSGLEAIESLEGFDDPSVTAIATAAIESSDPDAVVLVTAHPAFDAVDWTAFEDLVVVDGRAALRLDGTDHLVYTIGRS